MIKTRTCVNIFVLTIGLGIIPSPTFLRSDAAVKTSPSKTELANINTDMIDSQVDVEASIKSITPPREGSKAPFRIELADTTGSITLVIWPDIYESLKTKSPLSTGDVIHVNGKVTMYRDSLQLQIREAADVKIVTKAATDEPASKPATPTPAAIPAAAPTPPAPAGTTSLASITSAMVSQDVTVQATISEVREPRSERAPYTVTLSQENTRMPLVYWSDMHPQLKDKIKVGNQVRIQGQVSEYRGTLQIKIRNASDVTIVSAPTK